MDLHCRCFELAGLRKHAYQFIVSKDYTSGCDRCCYACLKATDRNTAYTICHSILSGNAFLLPTDVKSGCFSYCNFLDHSLLIYLINQSCHTLDIFSHHTGCDLRVMGNILQIVVHKNHLHHSQRHRHFPILMFDVNNN